MQLVKTSVTLAVFAVSACLLYGQEEDCNGLLSHYLYDTIRSSQRDVDATSELATYCRAIHSRERNSGALDSGGQYTPAIFGHFNLTADQEKQFDDSFCSGSDKRHNSEGDYSFFSSTIGNNARDMYRACLEHSEKLHVKTEYDEISQRTLGLSVWYEGKSEQSSHYTSATEIYPAPDGITLKCGGPLTNVKAEDPINQDIKSLHCIRILPDFPNITIGNRKLLAEPLDVWVYTDAGLIHRSLAALPPLPREDYIAPIPVGTVIAFAGVRIPDGWLPCDGSPHKTTDFPDLFAAIKTIYCGSQKGLDDCAEDTFRVPDYQGRFLRGVDGGTGRDAERESKLQTDKQPLLGSVQADSVGPHQHTITRTRVYGAEDDASDLDHHGWTEEKPANRGTLSVPTDAMPAGETRPKNVSVNWIIKAIQDRPPDPSYVANPSPVVH